MKCFVLPDVEFFEKHGFQRAYYNNPNPRANDIPSYMVRGEIEIHPAGEQYTESDPEYLVQVERVSDRRPVTRARFALSAIESFENDLKFIDNAVGKLAGKVQHFLDEKGLVCRLVAVQEGVYEFSTGYPQLVRLFTLRGSLDSRRQLVDMRIFGWDEKAYNKTTKTTTRVQTLEDVQNVFHMWSKMKGDCTQEMIRATQTLHGIEYFIQDMIDRGLSALEVREFTTFTSSDDAGAAALLRLDKNANPEKYNLFHITFRDNAND